MAISRTLEDQQHEQAALPADGDDAGFGAEFRELARQRRFIRSSADSEPAVRETTFWKTSEAGAAANPAAATTEQPAAAAVPAAPVMPVMPAAARAAARVRTPRMTEDQRATLMELARMSDRLVQSREALAVATTRVDQLETQLESAHDGLAAANDQIMASRVIVMDAQRTTRELAERSAWLEGRVEMLQEALELAVNASVVTRWKWRREQRARRRDLD